MSDYLPNHSTTAVQNTTVAQPAICAADLDVDLTVDLIFTWQNTLPTLLALIEDGVKEGRRFAKHELTRMAAAADHSREALAHLAVLVKAGQCQDPDVLMLLSRARALLQAEAVYVSAAPSAAECAGITITGDLVPGTAKHGFGFLAKQCSGKELALDVCYSARGFYIGTRDEGLPFSRESVEYWARREQAEAALTQGTWTQRDHP